MESEKVKEELKQARESIVKNKDVKSARVILEKCIIGDWVIVGGRVNYIKLATKILLDITTKQEKMIEILLDLYWNKEYPRLFLEYGLESKEQLKKEIEKKAEESE